MWTKEKQNAYNKKYYKKYKKKIKLQQKKYSEENKEQISVRIKKWKTDNKEKLKLKRKNWYSENKEEESSRWKKWYEENKNACTEYQKQYYESNKDLVKTRIKKWVSDNKEYVKIFKRNYKKLRLKTDINFKIKENLRRRILNAMRGANKSAHTLELLGCSIEVFKEHLEKQFKPGMDWSNHGQYGWHIDHIRPCASFDLTDPIQQRQCFHYTNLQPLWWKDNLSKNSKWHTTT